jgi:hypothetical protein
LFGFDLLFGFGLLFGVDLLFGFDLLFGVDLLFSFAALTYSRLPMRGFTYLKVAKSVNFLFNILFLEQIASHLLLYNFNFLFTYLKLSSSIDQSVNP